QVAAQTVHQRGGGFVRSHGRHREKPVRSGHAALARTDVRRQTVRAGFIPRHRPTPFSPPCNNTGTSCDYTGISWELNTTTWVYLFGGETSESISYPCSLSL